MATFGHARIAPHPLEQLAATGPSGGHVCGLIMPEHPLHKSTFGVVGTVTPLVDLWLDEGRLPSYMRWAPSHETEMARAKQS